MLVLLVYGSDATLREGVRTLWRGHALARTRVAAAGAAEG
jgi:hypothetical protein